MTTSFTGTAFFMHNIHQQNQNEQRHLSLPAAVQTFPNILTKMRIVEDGQSGDDLLCQAENSS